MAMNQKQTQSKTKKPDYRVSAPIEYTNGEETKTTWENIGIGFTGEKGIRLKIKTLPLNFTGDLMLFMNEQE